MSIITLLWLLCVKGHNQAASKSVPNLIAPKAGICGDETTLTCKKQINVTDPYVKYIGKWEKEGNPLVRSAKRTETFMSGKYKTEIGHGQYSLRIFNTSISDQGYYKCGLEYDWSIQSYLNVECVASSKFVTVTVASSKHFRIIIDRLFPGNVNISASLLQQNSTSTFLEGAHSCEPSMEPEYYRCQWNSKNPIKVGTYNCCIVITSVTQTVELVQHLKVSDRPAPPKQFHHTAITDTSVTLQWRPGYDGGLSQTFIIEYKKAPSLEWRNVSVSQSASSPDTIIYTLTGLSSGTEYQLKMYGCNAVGKSNTSQVEIIKTKDVQQDNEHFISHFAGSVGGLFGLANLIIVIIMCRRNNLSKERSKLEVNHLAGMEKPVERKEMAANICECELTENLVYASAVDPRIENEWNDDNAHTNNDLFAVIHEQPEPEITEHPSYESVVDNKSERMWNGERVKRDVNTYNEVPKEKDQECVQKNPATKHASKNEMEAVIRKWLSAAPVSGWWAKTQRK